MRAFLLLLALLAAGCDSGLSENLDYGDPYTLVIDGGRPALGVGEGRISVPVGYSGGCAEHAFSLRSDVTDGDATVWFVHDDGGDTCEAYIRQTLDVPLPGAVDAAERVTLRVPHTSDGRDETAIQLR